MTRFTLVGLADRLGVHMQRPVRDARAVVALGIGLALLHNLDEAFWHKEAGGVANLVGTAVVGGLLVVLVERIPAFWRAIVLIVLGLDVAAVGTVGHLVNLVSGRGHGADPSGVLFVAGGLVLLWLGVTTVQARERSS